MYTTYKCDNWDTLSVIWCFNTHTIHGWSGIYLHVILGTNDFSPLTKTQVVFSSSLSTCGHGVDVGKCPDGHWPHGGVVQPMGQHDNDAESCKKCNTILTMLSNNTSKGSWEDTCFFSRKGDFFLIVGSRESNLSSRWDGEEDCYYVFFVYFVNFLTWLRAEQPRNPFQNLYMGREAFRRVQRYCGMIFW